MAMVANTASVMHIFFNVLDILEFVRENIANILN